MRLLIGALLVAPVLGLLPTPHIALSTRPCRVAAPTIACAEIARQGDAAFPPKAKAPFEFKWPPLAQLSLLLSVYGAHVTWLSEVSVRLPIWPVGRLAVGADNVLGLAALYAARRWMKANGESRDSSNAAAATVEASNDATASGGTEASSDLPWGVVRTPRLVLLQTVVTLLLAYLFSGYIGETIEAVLHGLSAFGLPLSLGRSRALIVLLSHLAWVGMAVRVLGVRLKPFFPPPFGEGTWLRVRWRANWVGWAIGGYFASLLTYNCIDVFNQALLPAPLDAAAAAAAAEESVVSRLVHPEGGDLVALSIGCVGPCLSAPVFEEILYRGLYAEAGRTLAPRGLCV